MAGAAATVAACLNRRCRVLTARPPRRPPPCSRAVLFYHQQAITWAWYMLEPWETLLWMALLCLLSYFVLSACLVSPSSICRQGLVAAHQGLVERGAKLLAYTRQQ